MNVPTPIDANLRAFALARAAPVPDDALAQVAGQEHLLTHSGFIAQLVHMAGVPSLSPNESANLAIVARGVDEVLDTLDPELRAHMTGPLTEYRDALVLLSEIGFFSSAFLIAYLKQEVLDRPRLGQGTRPVRCSGLQLPGVRGPPRQTRHGERMTAHQTRRTMPLRLPNAGAATPQQEAIAALVRNRVREVRPDLQNVTVAAAQMINAMPPTTLQPADMQIAERLQAALGKMSDAEMGKTVGQAGRLLTRYLDESPNPSAELLRVGVNALKAGMVGLLRGGSSAAYRGFAEEHTRFDRLMFQHLNSDIVLTRVHAEQFVETQRVDLLAEIARERAVLAGEHQRLHDEREMALSAVSGAQAEATALRRELDAQRAADAQKLARAETEVLRLTRLLESERSANTNRERDTRNEIHQLRQDHVAQQSVVAHLNAECERLEGQAATPIPTEVSPMPTTIHRYAFATALEATSFTVYAQAQGAEAKVLGCLMTSPNGLDSCHFHAWKAAYPNPASMLAQLRAVVLPMLGRAA